MTKQEYINWLAPRVVLDSLDRNFLPSPRIAQGFFESAFGTSELAVRANNLFGVKNNDQWKGKCYNKATKECYDGMKLEDIRADFRAYDSWEESVVDQGDFLINRCTTPKYHPELKHYAELVGNRDYKDCARILKEKSYGTAKDYDQRVIDYVERYQLTQYDTMTREKAKAMISKESERKKMIINVHAGHNPDGKVACGATGYIKESTEARRVKDEVIQMLKAMGHTVYDCTVNDGTSASNVLKKIVSKCNAHKVDLDVSIHFNSAAGLAEDGNTTGTEVLVYSGYSKARDEAEAVCKAIATLGFKNRGVKFRPDLYFLKKTVAPAMLIECCFVNDKDDTNLYDYYKMAKAIVKGITGTEYVEEEEYEEVVETPNKEDEKLYHVALKRLDAEKVKETLRELGIDAIIVEE